VAWRDKAAMSFAHEALQSAPITFVSREIHSKRLGLQRQRGVVPRSGDGAGSEQMKSKANKGDET
jgi:hypothetical protein